MYEEGNNKDTKTEERRKVVKKNVLTIIWF
jgi:hypothetical protein